MPHNRQMKKKPKEISPEAIELLELADTYCKQAGKARATIATKIVNCGNFFNRIENGGNFTTNTYHKVKNWFLMNIKDQV